jgi:hypothetical protein
MHEELEFFLRVNERIKTGKRRAEWSDLVDVDNCSIFKIIFKLIYYIYIY